MIGPGFLSHTSVLNTAPREQGLGTSQPRRWTGGACAPHGLSILVVGTRGAAGGGGERPPEAAAGEGDHRGQTEEAGGRPNHPGRPELQTGQGEALGVSTVGCGEWAGPQAHGHTFPPLLTAALWLLLRSGFLFLGISWPLGARVIFEGMFLIIEWGPSERFNISPE